MLLRYPGGKSWIGEAVTSAARASGKSVVTEPFLGGGGSAIACMRAGLQVEAGDSNPYLCSLWNCVLDRPDDLVREVRRVRPSVRDFRGRWERLRSGERFDPLEEAISKLVVHQMSFSGMGEMAGSPIGGWRQGKEDESGRFVPARYPIDCRWNPDGLERRMRGLHDLLRKHLLGRVTCAGFEELLARGTDSLLYLDPPYYRPGGQLYAHGNLDHEYLRDVLLAESRPWILSYDAHDTILGWYEDRIRVSVYYRSKLVNSDSSGRELVVSNSEDAALTVRDNLPHTERLRSDSDLPVLVGEAPSRTGDRYWMFPLSGRPARVLCQVAGIPPQEDGTTHGRWTWALYDRFECRNLFDRYDDVKDGWSFRRARVRGEEMMRELDGRTVIALGNRTARALAGTYLKRYDRVVVGASTLVHVPHPSGLNRILNDPEERERLGTVLREA